MAQAQGAIVVGDTPKGDRRSRHSGGVTRRILAISQVRFSHLVSGCLQDGASPYKSIPRKAFISPAISTV